MMQGFPTDIGNILVRMGAISWLELHTAVEQQKAQPGAKLGELLMKDGVITDGILKEALQLQADLRSAKDVPVKTLVRIYDHALDAYRRTNSQMKNTLDMALAGGKR